MRRSIGAARKRQLDRRVHVESFRNIECGRRIGTPTYRQQQSGGTCAVGAVLHHRGTGRVIADTSPSSIAHQEFLDDLDSLSSAPRPGRRARPAVAAGVGRQFHVVRVQRRFGVERQRLRFVSRLEQQLDRRRQDSRRQLPDHRGRRSARTRRLRPPGAPATSGSAITCRAAPAG